ncbi:MAG TPA: hypothetical protein VE439_09340 [Anaerolineae bacterium]|jgi:ABC-type transport system involved in multi-copper enzyme maturation permease subunit|nr:hypothetical protein [Anaerolineae bacterium]
MATIYQHCYQDIKRLSHFPTFRYAIILILIAVALTNILFASDADKATFSWIVTFTDSFNTALYFATLSLIVVAAHYAASEYQNRTVQLSIATGISRGVFIFSKVLALIAGAYSLVFIAGLSSLVISAAIASSMGTFTAKALSLSYFALTLLLSPLKTLPLMFLSFSLAIMARSLILPISLLMFYATLGEIALTSFVLPSPVKDILPGQIAKPLDTITTFKINLAPNVATIERIATAKSGFEITYWASMEGVLAYVVVLTLCSYIVFRRQDLSR